MLSTTPSSAQNTLQLPFDYHRTPSTGTRLASHAFELTMPSGVSPDAALAAAFAIQLYRYNAQPSIILNASRLSAAGDIHWRRPFELPTPADAACRSVLERADEFLRSIDTEPASRDFPESWSGGSRAALTFLESERAADALGVVERSGVESRNDDLQLVAVNAHDRIFAAFRYNSDLFKKSSVERFSGHLRELIAHLALDLNAPISRLPLLPPAERRWIESVFTGSARESSAEFAHRSFESRAAAAPEAKALRFRDQTLTYREMNARANRLARHLAREGVGAESRIVVCLEPSFDIVVALLAILKAGAVYVPLDPSYPDARIRASLDDIQPRLILTHGHLRAKVAAEGVPVFAVEDAERLADGLSAENLNLAHRPEQTAYIYYTSGTTGKPKGVAASQANLASYIRVARDRYSIGAADVMPAIARFSFSISMFELMSPLAAGGTLLILDREHILDLERMSRTLEQTTIFHAGPSLLKNLIAYIKRRYPDFRAFSGVRHASSGGDMVSPEVLEGLKLIFSNAEVFVIYGCSEISCMGCTYPVSRERPVERTYVGRPFDDMSVRVLDHALNLVPVGVVGEIHFAGNGIVNGYVNRPELTAEKFVDLGGRRWYRTGDMGRLSEDGWLEILGRRDFQVKLRGMRVELGEVEHNLRRATGVRDGAVMARSTVGGDLSLVAYVVMEPGREESSIAAVHRHMVEHLPDYMVPSAYVELESLPLNHNMKVDRFALPEPREAHFRLAPETGFREPRTPTEKRLAALWRKLLGFDKIGLDDHFFDLGGHSVLGLTLILGVESELGVLLSGLEVLRESLEGQAALCDRRLGMAPAVSGGSTRAAAAADTDFEAFYFGEDRSLYGVLSGAAGKRRRAGEAVLICASVGNEHLRAHFILQRLAARLAAQGVPALRFDYHGCGDSLGESIDATCGRWRRDIAEAYHELKRRTGAPRITAVGVRLGAALLGGAARDLDLARLVVWDPVCDGEKYCAELASTHEDFTRSWRWLFRRRPAYPGGGTELIGLACSDANMRELKALAFPPRGALPPVKILDFDPGWRDVSRLNLLLPDVGVSTKLATMATEPS